MKIICNENKNSEIFHHLTDHGISNLNHAFGWNKFTEVESTFESYLAELYVYETHRLLHYSAKFRFITVVGIGKFVGT
jgi:hypothetical protein